MKRILILLALLGTMLTGCEKPSTPDGNSPQQELTPEQLLDAVQGRWIALSKEQTGGAQDSYREYTDGKKAPALFIEGTSITRGKGDNSGEFITLEDQTGTFTIKDGKTFTWSFPQAAEGNLEMIFVLDGDQLFETCTNIDNKIVQKFVFVKTDIPIRKRS